MSFLFRTVRIFSVISTLPLIFGVTSYNSPMHTRTYHVILCVPCMQYLTVYSTIHIASCTETQTDKPVLASLPTSPTIPLRYHWTLMQALECGTPQLPCTIHVDTLRFTPLVAAPPASSVGGGLHTWHIFTLLTSVGLCNS